MKNKAKSVPVSVIKENKHKLTAKEKIAAVEVEKEPEITAAPVIIEQPIMDRTEKVKPWSRSQIELVKRTIAVGATDDELLMFRWICHRTQLDPFSRQIYYVKRWDSKEGREKGAIQIGIDGFRVIAERTGKYAGNNDPEFEGELEKEWKKKDGVGGKYSAPEKAIVRVYKMVDGVRCEFTATARWNEYYPGDMMGFMWRSKSHIMLGKCAEALALRKAFPAVLSGIYVEGELDRVQVAPEKRPEEAFEKAKKMIGGQTDIKTLEDYYSKVEKSTLYSKEQKELLLETIEKKVVELKSNANIA